MKTVIFAVFLGIMAPCVIFAQSPEAQQQIDRDNLNDDLRRQTEDLKRSMGSGNGTYDGPSQFRTPMLRAHFGPAGATIDPALAAELDRRIPNAGKKRYSKTKGQGVFVGGEFEGLTYDEAINVVIDQFKVGQSGQPSGSRSSLDRDGSNAAFFAKQHATPQSAPVATTATVQDPNDPQFIASRDASTKMAAAHYPDSVVAGSEFNKKMVEIYTRLKAQNNDIVSSADAPWKIAQMAGNELGVAPLP